MSTRPRVRKPAEDRRREILAAARAEFATRGVAATPISAITDGAGVAKGTFYLHFDSKDHVLAALWSEYVDGFVEHLARVLASAASDGWGAVAERAVVELVDHDLANADVHLMVMGSATADARRLFRESNQRVLELLRDGIARGVAAGEFHVEQPELTADLIYYAAEGLLDELILSDQIDRRDEAVAALLQLVRRTLGLDA